jgi:RNA polymerase sigma-70 factor (ECF subfamily)
VTGDDTCWTIIEGAARGPGAARDNFASRYLPAVKAYLRARWRDPSLRQEVDDAAQEVFLECFRGALDRVGRDGRAGFRAFLYGIVRNVARRFEERRAAHRVRDGAERLPSSAVPADEASLSVIFDRAWAESVLARARALLESRAMEDGDDARRRVELLRLRLEEDVPIREIALRWNADPARLHHDYARARSEFKAALLDVVATEHSGTPGDVRRECVHLASYFR